MTIHLFTPPTQAARDRVTALEMEQLNRRVEDARVEEAARRAAILDDIWRETHPRVLRARRRQAWRRDRREWLLLLCVFLLAALVARVVLRYADQIDGWAR